MSASDSSRHDGGGGDGASAAASPSPSPSPPATSSAGLCFSFSFASKSSNTHTRLSKSIHTQLRTKDKNEDATSDSSRIVVSGSMDARSLAALHEAATTSEGKTKKAPLVIPLIRQTQWRGATSTATANQSDSTVAQIAHEGRASQQSNGAVGGSASASGISFESESDLIDAAYQQKQQLIKTESQAAAGGGSDERTMKSEVGVKEEGSEDALPDLERAAVNALLNGEDAPRPNASTQSTSISDLASYNSAKPILLSNALPGNSTSLSESARLVLDVSQRPDLPDLDAYERVPIEEFGMGMLRGMGWSGPGDPIGGINKKAVEPIVFQPRGERMGLGAEFAKVKDNRAPKRFVKPGEKREEGGVKRVTPKGMEESSTAASTSAAVSTAASTADLLKQTRAKLGSRLIQVHSQRLRVGSLCEIMEGPHRKLYGTVVSFPPLPASPDSTAPSRPIYPDSHPLDVRLNLSGELVHLRRGDIELLDARAIPDDHPAFDTKERIEERKKQKEQEEREQKKREQERSEREKSTMMMDDGEESKSRSDSSSRKRPRSRTRSRSRSRSRDRDRHRDERNGSSSKRHRSERDRDRDRDRDRNRDRDRDRDRHHDSRTTASSSSSYSSSHRSSTAASSSSSSSSTSSSSTRPRWVRSHIRVRLLSETVGGGRFYNTKGVVIDVVSRREVLIRPDSSSSSSSSSGSLLTLHERDLETVIPKPGSSTPVMILQGEHKGCTGRLMQRLSEKEMAVVQLEEDLDLVTVGFDDLAEYVP